ncbi:CBO0543 family protein [Anaerobacillus isosaccharinicus]|uniref:Uncharacterized protein n=1 Tax=Anaerobacillus isosaccharinicus TaxID=1532552 RepID=A0A1S2LB10_9BACI|nr:CBO0543 family protein [Anaerobacillus isosaccharinicus]MBA5588146.1 hypothetical protein [Anaerobacillus isosaccharinicus]QOY38400.1 hypothetical protein AWH56_013205 [Anaerobacillus isosaccharinicus]
MSIEVTILYVVWSATIISLFFIPYHHYRKASISFLFQQFSAWFLGILVVQWNLIEYPVRELASVNQTSFTFEFFVYPVIGIFFNYFYPTNSSLFRRILYYCFICTAITIPEVIIEKNTDLIHYVSWHWTVTWMSVYATLFLLRGFFSWFFKNDLQKNKLGDRPHQA